MGVRAFTASSSMRLLALLVLLRASPVSADGAVCEGNDENCVSLIQMFRSQHPNNSDKQTKRSGHKDILANILTETSQPGGEPTNDHATCSPLVNHGTHFTVEIEVGTPMEGTSSQKFDVVADTGSDAIIIPSCTCVQSGHCSNSSKCFTGANHSSSFGIQNGPQGPPSIQMMFGSGPVQAAVASDIVRVGNLRTTMKDGVLLMTDHRLNIAGPFEGILGLGLPGAEAKKGLYRQEPASSPPDGSAQPAQGSAADIQKALEDGGVNIKDLPDEIAKALKAAASGNFEQTWVADAQDLEPDSLPGMSPLALLEEHGSLQQPGGPVPEAASTAKTTEAKNHLTHHNMTQEKNTKANDTAIVVKGFMEEAGIKRFSMCFNDGKNGVLRLGTPKVESAHGSVGQVHWGLDFRGISVGNVSAPVIFCDSENMTEGQKTPCGAIPDSGTTALMAPAEHLSLLYDSLCDNWDRCRNNFTAMNKAAVDAHDAAVKAYSVDPFQIEAASKAMIFQHLILDCKRWLTAENGLDELPPVHFHVRGANGSEQALQLKGWSYIIETQQKEFKYVYQKIPGLGELPIGKNFTGKTNKVCSPAFSPMEYKTEQNGPVWILGTPLFYEYQVGYDMEAKPPAISFLDEPCGSCEGTNATGNSTASFMSESATTKRGYARKPRQVNGPFRTPNMDFAMPF